MDKQQQILNEQPSMGILQKMLNGKDENKNQLIYLAGTAPRQEQKHHTIPMKVEAAEEVK
jgi:hypothetical protein